MRCAVVRMVCCCLVGCVLWVVGAGAVEAAPVFPLKVSANGRYLTDQNNAVYRLQGDTPWDLLVNATASETDTYLANRAAKGFNALLVELVEHRAWVAGSPAPANRNGARPFLSKLGGGAYTGAGDLADLSTPNDAYFQYVDTIVAKIAAKNMVLLLTPLYVGYGAPTTQSSSNEGWSADMYANSSANCYKYGQYVGDRYRNQKNIIWVDGGDAFKPASNIATCTQQVIQGTKDGKGNGGSTVLRTSHWSRGHLSTDDASVPVPVNSVYGESTTLAALCRSAYGRTPVLPAYVIEADYEGYNSTRAQLRRQGYQAALSCVGGYMFGNSPIWTFGTGWQAAMDFNGSTDWQRAGVLLDSLAWQTLVPSNLGALAGTILVTGGADIASGGDVAAAASSTALVAYLPSTGTAPRTITVTLSVLGAYARGRWYNPTSGLYTDITGGAYTLPNTGTHAFTTPGNNGSGTNDWALVLDIRPPTQRTWVSSDGSDANECSLSAPCRSLATAIALTTSGGDVVVVDSAAYGTVSITKPVSIVASPGIYAGISVLSGTGIVVNPGSGAVTLRGLTINGLGGAVGIDFQSGDALYVEQSAISGFATSGLNAASNSPRSVFIRDTQFRNNAVGAVFSPLASAPATLNVVIERSKFEGNSTGARFSGNSMKGEVNNTTIVGGATGIAVQPGVGGAAIKIDVRKSTVAGTTGAGVSAGNGTAGTTATVNLLGAQLTKNGTGLSVGTGGSAYVTDSIIMHNAIGVGLAGGGTAVSLRDNRLLNNTNNGAFSSSVSKL